MKKVSHFECAYWYVQWIAVYICSLVNMRAGDAEGNALCGGALWLVTFLMATRFYALGEKPKRDTSGRFAR